MGGRLGGQHWEVWSSSPNPNLDFSALPKAITVRGSGLKNLGAAISTYDDFIQALFLKRVEKCENLIDSIRLLEDPQLELHLLRSCAALPKITFSIRTCDPFSISTCLDQFDNAVHLCLEYITGSALLPSQRLQCSLPVAKGGLGLPISSSIAPVAFLGCYIDIKYLSDRIFHNTKGDLHRVELFVLPRVSQWQRWHSFNGTQSQMKLKPTWFQVLVRAHVIRLYAQDRVRLLSCSLSNSGGWLSAVHLKALGLILPAAEFRFAVCYRLSEFPYSTASLRARNVPGL